MCLDNETYLKIRCSILSVIERGRQISIPVPASGNHPQQTILLWRIGFIAK